MAQLEGILGTREYSTHSHIFGIIDRFFTTHEMTILCHDLPFDQLDDRNVLSLCSKHFQARSLFEYSTQYPRHIVQIAQLGVCRPVLITSVCATTFHASRMLSKGSGDLECLLVLCGAQVSSFGQMRHYVRSEGKGASSWHRGPRHKG